MMALLFFARLGKKRTTLEDDLDELLERDLDLDFFFLLGRLLLMLSDSSVKLGGLLCPLLSLGKELYWGFFGGFSFW